MKKPIYMSDIYAFVFLSLGLGFIFFGCLSFLNITKPTAHSSVQDPILAAQIFCILGTTMCVIQSVFRINSKKQAKIHRELISTGTKIEGTIDRISFQKGITFGRKSPYIIFFTYLYEDRVHHNKSCLIWDHPSLNKGNKIDIFVNDIGQSTLAL